MMCYGNWICCKFRGGYSRKAFSLKINKPRDHPIERGNHLPNLMFGFHVCSRGYIDSSRCWSNFLPKFLEILIHQGAGFSQPQICFGHVSSPRSMRQKPQPSSWDGHFLSDPGFQWCTCQCAHHVSSGNKLNIQTCEICIPRNFEKGKTTDQHTVNQSHYVDNY